MAYGTICYLPRKAKNENIRAGMPGGGIRFFSLIKFLWQSYRPLERRGDGTEAGKENQEPCKCYSIADSAINLAFLEAVQPAEEAKRMGINQ